MVDLFLRTPQDSSAVSSEVKAGQLHDRALSLHSALHNLELHQTHEMSGQ